MEGRPMGNPYTSVSVTSYNSNPPADDGSETAANRVNWSTHKTKIGDPLKAAIETVNTNVNTALTKIPGGAGITSTATTYEVVTGDQGKLIKVTGSATITTPDATTVGSPFIFGVSNLHTASITIDGNGSQTIDGAASITLPAGNGVWFETDGTNWFTFGQNFTRSFPPAALYKNKSIKVASTTTVTVAADFVVVTNGAGLYQTVPVSSTVNLGTTGVDALATGTIAIDTWYYLWAVSQADGTTKVIASTRSTADATFLSELAAIASGVYTYYGYMGAVQTIHGSATLYGTWQIGNRAQYVVGLASTSALPFIGGPGSAGNATTPTYVALAVARFVPATARSIRLVVGTTGTGTTIVSPNNSYGGIASTTNPPYYSFAELNTARGGGTDMILESTNIYWAAGGTNGGYIQAAGWEE